MKRNTVKCALAIFALAAAPAVAYEREEPVPVNTESLQSHVAEQVKEFAAEGERELMGYLWFTRRMHHLWLDDVMQPVKGDTKVAAVEEKEKREPTYIRSTGIR